MSDMTFEAVAFSESATRSRVVTRQFSIVVDEPAQLGGTDAGPNPVEYLLASLVGCLNVVAHVVGAELGIQWRRLQISASGRLNPDRFLGRPTSDRAGFQQIAVRLEVDSDAPAELLSRWLKQIEQRCPVADTLSGPTPVALTYSSVMRKSEAG